MAERPVPGARDTDAFDARAVVLVEGVSDQLALAALAARRGLDLEADGIAIVPIGGAQAIRHALGRFGPEGLDVRLAGLCDAGEEGHFRQALERAGLGSGLSRPGLESLGFFVCEADLEDELIRCLGVDAVEGVLDARGELGSFRTLQKQPAWRGRPADEQLRRFLGTHSGRKIQTAALLVGALDLERVPTRSTASSLTSAHDECTRGQSNRCCYAALLRASRASTAAASSARTLRSASRWLGSRPLA